MLSDEEKQNIIQRVHFEQEVKSGLAQTSRSKRFAWINSKVSLLIIGAIITGILVPQFQSIQQSLEWKRQNRYDTVNFRLGKMREGLREFVYLSKFSSEAYERIQPFMSAKTVTVEEYKDFMQQFIELQNRRFEQNAKVTALSIHFRDQKKLNQYFKDYVVSADNYLRAIKAFVYRKHSLMKQTKQEHFKSEQQDTGKYQSENKEMELLLLRIDNYPSQLNEAYDRVVTLMKNELGRVEDESRDFRF